MLGSGASVKFFALLWKWITAYSYIIIIIIERNRLGWHTPKLRGHLTNKTKIQVSGRL